MEHKIPILLSFYGLSSKSSTMLLGQLTFSKLKDFSFKDYSRRKTFRTLFSLYQTKPYSNQNIVLVFDKGNVDVKTDAYGAFYLTIPKDLSAAILQKVVMASGEEVKLITGLYLRHVQQILSETIVVSDIDDTLMHSFIFRKIMKFKTLMFTTVEKRKPVVNMQKLLHQFTDKGAASFYLSNSEQNLYPLIYRFLLHNGFPPGPLFLKKIRKLWQVLRNIKFPLKNIHKQQTLDDIIGLFPDKKFVLMGDNTQHDLTIYLEAAEKFPQNIRYIIIRKVIKRKADEALIKTHSEKLSVNAIKLYYTDTFPDTFEF